MPWRECHTMDERLRFVARLVDGEKMARLCREKLGEHGRAAEVIKIIYWARCYELQGVAVL